jgi:K+-sensing histidine kinase KdpD
MNLLTSSPQDVVDLESVITTTELSRRSSRPPNHEAENRALVALALEMANSPDNILQRLTDFILDLCRAHSAGISVLDPDRKRFRWRAIAGQWAPHRGGGTPRDFGPCGTVLDRDVAQLFSRPERHFAYLVNVTPCIEEGLLVPFHVNGTAVGTIWAIVHDHSRQFDAEDKRMLESLGTFASSAYQVVSLLDQRTRDMTALEEAHTLQRALLDSISHTLRTPLTSITGALSSLSDDGDKLDPWDRKALLDTARNEAVRLNRRVGHVLDITRVRAGALRPRIEPCDIEDVIGAALRDMKDATGARSISVDIAPGLPIVPMDFVLIEQVLVNLLDNALKYSPPNTPVSISARRESAEVEVTVTDEGPGISEQALERVFDEFFRGDGSPKTVGIGLGLAICKGFIDVHGGHVHARRQSPNGMTFGFRLPVQAVGGPPPPTVAE